MLNCEQKQIVIETSIREMTISIEMMTDVNVLFKMIMVRNRTMTCDLSDAEVSDIIAQITVC